MTSAPPSQKRARDPQLARRSIDSDSDTSYTSVPGTCKARRAASDGLRTCPERARGGAVEGRADGGFHPLLLRVVGADQWPPVSAKAGHGSTARQGRVPGLERRLPASGLSASSRPHAAPSTCAASRVGRGRAGSSTSSCLWMGARRAASPSSALECRAHDRPSPPHPHRDGFRHSRRVWRSFNGSLAERCFLRRPLQDETEHWQRGQMKHGEPLTGPAMFFSHGHTPFRARPVAVTHTLHSSLEEHTHWGRRLSHPTWSSNMQRGADDGRSRHALAGRSSTSFVVFSLSFGQSPVAFWLVRMQRPSLSSIRLLGLSPELFEARAFGRERGSTGA